MSVLQAARAFAKGEDVKVRLEGAAASCAMFAVVLVLSLGAWLAWEVVFILWGLTVGGV